MQKIMFNDRFLLTQAVLEGRKTQTRRELSMTLDKRVGGNLIRVYPERVFLNDGKWKFDFEERTYLLPRENYPRYKVGEVVAVAQSYEQVYTEMIIGFVKHNHHLSRKDSAEKFRKKYEQTKGWKNKMFVKSELMPHRIEITNVRLQRLQNITDEECLLEGIEKEERTDGEYNYTFFDAERELYIRERTPRDAYARLIDAISGKGTWYSNPYVFAYDFELI